MSDSQLRVLQDQISTLLQQRSGLSQQQQQPQQLPMQQQPQPQLDRHHPRSGPAAVEEVPSQEGSSPLGGGTSSVAPEMRNLMASGPQRSGEEMDTTLSSTLDPVPGPFACQGSPADGDDASQGPFWFFEK